MQTKTCTKCHKEKGISLFSKAKTGKFGVRGDCKDCRNEHYNQNREKFAKQKRDYNRQNKQKVLAQRKAYVERHKEDVYARNREYQQRNKKILNNKRGLYIKSRIATDISFKIERILRARILHALKGKNKSKKTLKLFGCTIEELKQHLESQFQEGMNWNNHGFYGWHIDHIKPCASFDLSKPEEQKKCFHYTNLQPLWMKDNLKKWKN